MQKCFAVNGSKENNHRTDLKCHALWFFTLGCMKWLQTTFSTAIKCFLLPPDN